MDPNQDNQNGDQTPQAPAGDPMGGDTTPSPEPMAGGDQAPAQDAPQDGAAEEPGAVPPPPPAMGDQPADEQPSGDTNPAA